MDAIPCSTCTCTWMLDCYHLFIYKIILTSLVIDILSHNSLPNQKFVNLSTIYACFILSHWPFRSKGLKFRTSWSVDHQKHLYLLPSTPRTQAISDHLSMELHWKCASSMDVELTRFCSSSWHWTHLMLNTLCFRQYEIIRMISVLKMPTILICLSIHIAGSYSRTWRVCWGSGPWGQESLGSCCRSVWIIHMTQISQRSIGQMNLNYA